MSANSPQLPKRGRGRPPGSKNKPKPGGTAAVPRKRRKLKTGPKEIEISHETVVNAAAIHCTVSEIAAIIGISYRRFKERIAADQDLQEAIEAGRERGKASLRRKQWEAAQNGNTTMMIWLGKQMLGQADRHEHSGPNGAPIDVRNLTTEQLVALLAAQGVQPGDLAPAGDNSPDQGGAGTAQDRGARLH